MSANALLNLLNEFGKRIRCETLPNFLSLFPREFNKSNNTGARMQDSIYYLILQPHFNSDFFNPNTTISPFENATFVWLSKHNFRN